MSVVLTKASTVLLTDAGEGGTESVTASASAERDLGIEGKYVRFYAASEDVYLSGGNEGTVTAPAASGATQGLKIPSGEERDFFVPARNGKFRVRHIGGGATALVYKPVSP